MHRLSRAIPLTAALTAGLLLPAAAPAITPVTPAGTRIGRATVASAGAGERATLLVPVRYPIELKGRQAGVRVTLSSGGRVAGRARARAVLSGGLARRPDRRGSFAFVHRVTLGRRASAALLRPQPVSLRIAAAAVLDVEGDGRAEARSSAVARQRLSTPALLTLRPAPTGRQRQSAPLCSSVPLVRAAARGATRIALPACDRAVRWSLAARPGAGSARVRAGAVVYRPARGHRGRDELTLRARPAAGARTSQTRAVTVPVQVIVGAPAGRGPVVRALGDSVTAGFGYYADGTAMGITDLPGCRPGDSSQNDACSSNATNTASDDGPVRYAPDYGLANDVAWPAQWANRHGITDYANFAVSGSAPADWAPGGQFYRTTQAIEAADPDYVVFTLGANPLLSDVLFGIDEMGCAIYSDLLGGYTQCVDRWLRQIGLAANLAAVYRELLTRTDATILVMQYHLAIPASALLYSARQIEQLGDLTNGVIASVAASFGTPRLKVVAPPRFDVGIDMTPLAPNTYSCSRLGYQVDGPSVQSSVSQAELLVDHPLSFCRGPAGGGDPWIISADTGIHPSVAGHAQFAGALPAP